MTLINQSHTRQSSWQPTFPLDAGCFLPYSKLVPLGLLPISLSFWPSNMLSRFRFPSPRPFNFQLEKLDISPSLYASTPMPMASSSTTASKAASPPETSPWTSPLEGLRGVPIHQYIGIRDVRKRVHAQSDELQANRSNQQYLVFRGVTKTDVAKMDDECERARIGKHTRMTHYADVNLLVIKSMPSPELQAAYLSLTNDFYCKCFEMGLSFSSLVPLGGTTFFGPNSSKEGDSTFKPTSRNRRMDWPTIVFESGYSESLARLRHDARSWFPNSGGEVKIAVVVSITLAQKRLRVEKWCLSPATGHRPATRTRPNPKPHPPVPTRMQEIIITRNPAAEPNGATSYTVTGAPLIFELRDLLLRDPVPPECDLTFTAADLSDWANHYWRSVNM